MHAHVDENTCIGCELCESTCPAVFRINDSDIAVVITAPVPVDAEDNCREAVRDCPVEAITLER